MIMRSRVVISFLLTLILLCSAVSMFAEEGRGSAAGVEVNNYAVNDQAAEEDVPEADAVKEESAKVTVVMYHLVSKGKAKSRYIISPDELESDLKYLRDNGFATVVMQDLIDFVDGRSELPAKPVVLSFDDGNFSD